MYKKLKITKDNTCKNTIDAQRNIQNMKTLKLHGCLNFYKKTYKQLTCYSHKIVINEEKKKVQKTQKNVKLKFLKNTNNFNKTIQNCK